MGLFVDSISRTMKSNGKKNPSTLIRTFSINPCDTFMDRSASCNVTGVGLSSPKEKRLYTELGNKFILDLRSNKTLSVVMSPMTQE